MKLIHGNAVIAVEGKVEETFDKVVPVFEECRLVHRAQALLRFASRTWFPTTLRGGAERCTLWAPSTLHPRPPYGLSGQKYDIGASQ